MTTAEETPDQPPQKNASAETKKHTKKQVLLDCLVIFGAILMILILIIYDSFLVREEFPEYIFRTFTSLSDTLFFIVFTIIFFLPTYMIKLAVESTLTSAKVRNSRLISLVIGLLAGVFISVFGTISLFWLLL